MDVEIRGQGQTVKIVSTKGYNDYCDKKLKCKI